MLSLAVHKLEIRYPGLPAPALDIPALFIEPGTHIALTGPSGAGKTTFINIAVGMERARSGKVEWDGENLAAMSEGRRDRWRARNVGLVMQDFHLFSGLSALGNVLLPQRLSRFRLPGDMRSRALDMLARVGIDRADQPVETMSRGQMQRVAVARALVGRPGVIIADEPTASLDAGSGEAVASLLFDLARETKATLIVATHDARLTGRLDRILQLENGWVSG
ncbi:ABC transporter ATP-binding protein [Pseudaminobacter salicylatoxidans]|uniref:ABC transporter ATP-binding protein n=1 Tax=Pseudaminobacter salicylatoxidans TaxID=93369 RepID=UPI0002E6D5D7|nr:ATP-binding cassette domain-containing protein [Pseudaminobacter salicylatoxidans]